MRKVSAVLSLAAVLSVLKISSGIAQGPPPAPDPKSPQYRAKGEQNRTYIFPGTRESIAYHIYVPSNWDPNTKLPLVVVTHGANQPATAPFQRPMDSPTLAKTAEQRGYLVAAVTGYHANATGVGGWNVPYQMIQVPNRARRRRRPTGGGDPPAPPSTQDFERAGWTCSTSPISWRRNTTRIRGAST